MTDDFKGGSSEDTNHVANNVEGFSAKLERRRQFTENNRYTLCFLDDKIMFGALCSLHVCV